MEEKLLTEFNKILMNEDYAEAFAFAIDNGIERSALRLCIEYIQDDDERSDGIDNRDANTGLAEYWREYKSVRSQYIINGADINTVKVKSDFTVDDLTAILPTRRRKGVWRNTDTGKLYRLDIVDHFKQEYMREYIGDSDDQG